MYDMFLKTFNDKNMRYNKQECNIDLMLNTFMCDLMLNTISRFFLGIFRSLETFFMVQNTN